MASTQRRATATPISKDNHASEENNSSLASSWFWQPNVIVFVSSCCIMILELVAGRIVAPYVGVSLYTWTSIIGVVLAGISLGNYLGGRLADRFASLRLLGGVFFLAGLTSLGILGVDALGRSTFSTMPIIPRILVLTTALFFLPCLILGMVSPIVTKLSLRNLSETGTTVGKIQAFATVGSIVGTFATGFLLISLFGTHTIVWGVALLLLTLGAFFLLGSRWYVLLLIPVLAGSSMVASAQGWLEGPCTEETNYFCIRVYPTERSGEVLWALALDRMVHSYTSLEDPTRMAYGYEQAYAEITAYRAQEDENLRTLSIGGGGYTYPKFMEAAYPESENHVIEIDPGVTEIAHEMLGLSRDTEIVSFNEDARLYLEREPTERYDLIFGDAFNDYSVPYHLTTKSFNERVKAWLEPDGIYIVNMIDGPTRDFLRAYIHTLQQTFDHVYLAPTDASWRRLSHGTFVLVASDEPLDKERLTSMYPAGEEPTLTKYMLSDQELEAMLDKGDPVILTDRYAPVEQMLAPAFRDQPAE